VLTEMTAVDNQSLTSLTMPSSSTRLF